MIRDMAEVLQSIPVPLLLKSCDLRTSCLFQIQLLLYGYKTTVLRLWQTVSKCKYVCYSTT